MNNINWTSINFPPQEQDYQTFEMNNKSIALNVLRANQEKISHLYKSEFNETREKQVILLMITDNEKHSPHYLFVKSLNASLKKEYACSENYRIDYLKSFRTKQKLKITSVSHFHSQENLNQFHSL